MDGECLGLLIRPLIDPVKHAYAQTAVGTLTGDVLIPEPAAAAGGTVSEHDELATPEPAHAVRRSTASPRGRRRPRSFTQTRRRRAVNTTPGAGNGGRKPTSCRECVRKKTKCSHARLGHGPEYACER